MVQLLRKAVSAVCLAVALLAALARAEDAWIDVSTPLVDSLKAKGVKQPYPTGCSGVVVNRLTGDVTIKVVGCGLWRSTDKGANWQQIADKTIVSGTDMTGWATQMDQNDPKRMISFSLDGLAGWTLDGVHWKSLANVGRNWNYGSVDWSSATPTTLIASKHESTPPGDLFVSSDAGATWSKLAVSLASESAANNMVGALEATTLIYCNGHGIFRSTDLGAHWANVSAENPLTRVPVLFHGTYYLGTANGLLVSKDNGASWHSQGTAANIRIGPFFGADENEMVIFGHNGVFGSTDAGKTWTHLADLKSNNKVGYPFGVDWIGCYAWDPINRLIYASAIGHPVFKLELGKANAAGATGKN